jgi:hypothetical protein
MGELRQSLDDYLFLILDELRQREIEQENEAAAVGRAVLSKHPAWNAIQAEICSLKAAELEKPLAGDIHQERIRAFEVFDKNAGLHLPAVTGTDTADAFC